MPPHLAQRLQHDQSQFEKHLSPTQLEESLESASKRHEQVIHQKQMQSHQQVEHAREVAATHESRPEDTVPGRVLHDQGEKLGPLESSVEQKKASVNEKQKELQDLEERLRQAEEKEKEMKRKLELLG
ncbi:uncharacterized protein JCM6883_000865 [Sporobolomyces salmoneus]|uniref:uncharacterized protein n=1 Tax=Sporobolomyces salmoneus TaxID=183962 RepID=UPI0031725018